MQIKKVESIQENFKTYFPYFNHSFFVDQTDYSEDETCLSDESSTNLSQDSLNSLENEERLIPLNLLDFNNLDYPETEKDFEKLELKNQKGINKIKPELQKSFLTKTLFDKSKINKNEKYKLKKNLDAEPYIPKKNQLYQLFMTIYPTFFFNDIKNSVIKKKQKDCFKNKINLFCINYSSLNFHFRCECNNCANNRY